VQRNVVLVERGRVDLEDTARMPERPDRVPDARGPVQPDGAKELCARLLVERLVLAGSGVTARRVWITSLAACMSSPAISVSRYARPSQFVATTVIPRSPGRWTTRYEGLAKRLG
jgi:hypothetical protein